MKRIFYDKYRHEVLNWHSPNFLLGTELISSLQDHGYVLKYVGDAIIVFFPSGFNKYFTYDNAVHCVRSMMKVLKNGINPVLNNDFSQENVVVQYGYEKRSPIDLLVYCMNVAAKITFLTAPNKISIGENIYELLHPKIQLEFQGLTNLNEKETEIH